VPENCRSAYTEPASRLLRTTCDPALLIGTPLGNSNSILGTWCKPSLVKLKLDLHEIYNRGGVEGGLGLTNLRRRAEKLNGNFEVASLTGGGTHLIWRVPYSA
jgi:hypothetical protein